MNNEETIKAFLKDMKQEGLAKITLENYDAYLHLIDGNLKKPFKTITAKDFESYFETVKMKPSSKAVFKIVLKRFYRWLYDLSRGHYPPAVAKLHISRKELQNDKLRPETVLNKADIANMINHGKTFRDQAIVAVLYESAARATEFLNINVGHILFDKDGAVVMVDGKTGKRRIRLVESVPYLQQWMQVHPQKTDPNAPLWVTSQGDINRLSDSSLWELLEKIGKRAGIKNKPLNPHALRHGRITETSKFLSDAKQRKFSGWTNDSRMVGVYTHLSGADLDEDIIRAAGGKPQTETPTPSPLKPKLCRRCNESNPGPAEFCSRCGLSFNPSSVIDTTIPDLQKQVADLSKQLHDFLSTGVIPAHPVSAEKLAEIYKDEVAKGATLVKWTKKAAKKFDADRAGAILEQTATKD